VKQIAGKKSDRTKMKIKLTCRWAKRALCLILTAIVNVHVVAFAQTPAFTFQGELTDKFTGVPVTGTNDMLFYLRDGQTGEGVVGATNVFDGNLNDPVWVDKGLFTVTLNFSADPFAQGARLWLQIESRSHASGNAYERQTNRIEITSAPYAIHARSAGTVDTLPNNIVTNGTIAAGQVVKSLNGLTDNVSLSVGPNVSLTTNGNNLQISATTGAGVWNLNGASAYYNGGYVGIGTTTPSTKLELHDLDHVEIGLGSEARSLLGNGTALWTLESTAHMVHPPLGNDYVVGEFQIIDRTAGASSRLSINEVGYVGIGTTTPAANLDVHGDLAIGTGINNENHKLTIRGPNSPAGGGSAQDLSFEFAAAGSAKVRAYRGSSWDTYLQFLTTDASAGSDNPQVRLHIDGDGRVLITSKLDVVGDASYSANLLVTSNASVSTLTIRGGSDLAEPFQMSEVDIPKGSLVIIDDESPGKLKLAGQEYDTRVAGIVSGANGINPGISLHQEGVTDLGQNVALSGRVYALADATYGAIKPGDLLTSSGTPGHVMKVTNHARAQGAIVGKAMSGLKGGKGMVLVLVSLQ
jgi:hypothetical protein